VSQTYDLLSRWFFSLILFNKNLEQTTHAQAHLCDEEAHSTANLLPAITTLVIESYLIRYECFELMNYYASAEHMCVYVYVCYMAKNK